MTLNYHQQLWNQIRTKPRVKRLAVCLVMAAMVPCQAIATEIDLTRYLSEHVKSSEESDIHEASFFGVAGSARLIINAAGRTTAINRTGQCPCNILLYSRCSYCKLGIVIVDSSFELCHMLEIR